jgi:uncharacterized protein (TIGR03435 family)
MPSPLLFRCAAATTLILAADAQPPAGNERPSFEAASVKPNRGTGKRDRTRAIEPGRLTYLDTTLGEFIALAYNLKPYQLSGPDWIVNRSSAVTFDIVATSGKPVPVGEMKRLLASLLGERFHLAFHRETRELPVFALMLAKGGPKFTQPGDGGAPAIAPNGPGGMYIQNWSMERFADWLSILPGVRRPVLDRTGLAGSFSFDANLFNLEKGATPEEVKRAMVDGDAAGTLRATLPDQLGLRLESQKAPIEILVIDRADKLPAEN